MAYDSNSHYQPPSRPYFTQQGPRPHYMQPSYERPTLNHAMSEQTGYADRGYGQPSYDQERMDYSRQPAYGQVNGYPPQRPADDYTRHGANQPGYGPAGRSHGQSYDQSYEQPYDQRPTQHYETQYDQRYDQPHSSTQAHYKPPQSIPMSPPHHYQQQQEQQMREPLRENVSQAPPARSGPPPPQRLGHAPKPVVNGHAATGDPRNMPVERGRDPRGPRDPRDGQNKHHQQPREKSAPPARRKPLIEAFSPVTIPQDNAFPTFPTKKESDKARIRDSTGEHSVRSRDSDIEPVRPSTAGAASSKHFLHTDEAANPMPPPSTLPRRDRFGSDHDEPNGHAQRPPQSDHQLSSRPAIVNYFEKTLSFTEERPILPHLNTDSLSVEQRFGHVERHQVSPVNGPHMVHYPPSQPAQGSYNDDQYFEHGLRPPLQHIATDPGVGQQRPRFAAANHFSPTIAQRPATATEKPIVHHQQAIHAPMSARAMAPPDRPWIDDRQNSSGREYQQAAFYSEAPSHRSQTASMIRAEQIESEMPDFDNVPEEPKSRSAHQRGLTIDQHLNDVPANNQPPPPLPSHDYSAHAQPSVPVYKKPVYKSSPQPDEAEIMGPESTGFVFGIPGEEQQSAPSRSYDYTGPPPVGAQPPSRLPYDDTQRQHGFQPGRGPPIAHSVAVPSPPQDQWRHQPPNDQAGPRDPRQPRPTPPPGPQYAREALPVGRGPPPQAMANPRMPPDPRYPPGPYQGQPRGLPPNGAGYGVASPPPPSTMSPPPLRGPMSAQAPRPPQHGMPRASPASQSGYSAHPGPTGPNRRPLPGANGARDPREARERPSQQVPVPVKPAAVPYAAQQPPRHDMKPPPARGAQQPAKPSHPDALPHHPVPVRPGLTDPVPTQAARPAPVRQYDQTSNTSTTSLAKSAPPDTTATDERPLPVTPAELAHLRTKVDANPADHKAALYLAKRLVEASVVLASENGRLDAKATSKNRERYILDAHKRIKRLVQAGYSEAMFYLADCYGQGMLGLEIDTKEAFSLYLAAAKLGHAGAAYRTAVCCEMGPEEGGGTRKDPVKAVQWYRRAAQLQDDAAMYKLGVILLKGLLGQPRNVAEAVVWLKKAVEQTRTDNPRALHELALLHESTNVDPAVRDKIVADDKYARDLFIRAAKMGYKASQYRLGQAYEYGSLGLPTDPRNSIAWYSKAAAQGDHGAELSLSGWYLTGVEGILEHSDTEAYLWARKAASGEPPQAKAMFAMGYYTENGIGCPANLEDAKRWYARAASFHFPKAIERLEELKKGGSKSRPRPPDGRLRQNQKRDEAECTIM
ncbi:hypothetical protein AAFC00_001404 [Neodothiora populina]|uniref:HCP-like protein n=1 Tax=Neodothiora populina TaxID=2781224 RepID=A0ABR3PP66_9PEZI